MSKVPVNLLRSDGLAPSAQESSLEGLSKEQRSEIEELFGAALAGALPRSRELKPWEPATLNERHITMIMMRSGGLKQKDIAEIMGVTDATVSIALNHPDSVFLLSRLQAARFSQPTDIERRMAALNEEAMSSLEEFFSPAAEVPVVKRAPLAFKLLEANGHGRKKKVEHEHKHRFEASPEAIGQLTKALRESKEIPETSFVDVTDVVEGNRLLTSGNSPGGGTPDSPPSDPSQDAAAPSSGGSQENPLAAEANDV